MSRRMRRRNHLRGARVLLVEDAKDIRDVFMLLLEAEGAEVAPTGSGREGRRCHPHQALAWSALLDRLTPATAAPLAA